MGSFNIFSRLVKYQNGSAIEDVHMFYGQAVPRKTLSERLISSTFTLPGKHEGYRRPLIDAFPDSLHQVEEKDGEDAPVVVPTVEHVVIESLHGPVFRLRICRVFPLLPGAQALLHRLQQAVYWLRYLHDSF